MHYVLCKKEWLEPDKRAKVERLMKHPEKQAYVPERKPERDCMHVTCLSMRLIATGGLKLGQVWIFFKNHYINAKYTTYNSLRI